MKKRIIIGLIVFFMALAAQDRLAGSHFDVPIGRTSVLLPETSSLLKPGFNRVTRVVDGDTIVVLIDGVSEKVRLIGVDTPETVDPRKPVECFGKEASAFTKSLLLVNGQAANQLIRVRLETDASQGNRDKYGRLLRYVYQGDTLVNKKIISEGFGHEYTYHTPYQYQTEFKTAEHSAREAQKGLWKHGVCGA